MQFENHENWFIKECAKIKKKKMNYKVTYTPSEKNIEQLHKWLLIGRFHGYFANNLHEALDNGVIIIVTFEEEAIGYLLYEEESPLNIYIRGAEINPDFQRRGVGQLLVNSCIAKFKQEGKSVIYLKSVYNSETFWIKMGFNDRFISEDTEYPEENPIYLRRHLR